MADQPPVHFTSDVIATVVLGDDMTAAIQPSLHLGLAANRGEEAARISLRDPIVLARLHIQRW